MDERLNLGNFCWINKNLQEFYYPSYIPDMRLGLHFEIADTPPLTPGKSTEKSEIYQDLAKSKKLRKTEKNKRLPKVEDWIRLSYDVSVGYYTK